MTDQLAAPAYPAEPADLFVDLYDALPDHLFRTWEPTGWYDDPAVNRQANDITEIVLDRGELPPTLTAHLIAEHGDLGRFTLLLGLDGALAHANPYGPYHDTGALTEVLTNWTIDGRLNGPGSPGALLPRCAFPGRPRGLRSKAEFFGVHRIPPAEWEKIDHIRLPAVNDPHFARERPVTVGCAPMLESFDDVEIEFERRHGMTVYRLRPVDSAALRGRIKTIIRRLDESGAQIAVMPEVALSETMLEQWKEEAFDTAGRDRERHPLRFLMLGTGPLGGGDPPPNRAVLIDRWTGEELLVQDKLSGFTLDAAQMRLWRLPGAPRTGTAEEYAAPGSTIRVLDSSLGRLAVLICEDISRTVGWERELQSCGVSHLLVPIFSKPIMEYRWEQQAAERQVGSLGTWVTVANSLAIGRAIPESELPGPRYTCLVAGPENLARTTYSMELQFGTAETGDGIGLLKPGEDPPTLPRLYPGAAYDLWHDHWRPPPA
ncbi:hypothetical protein [Spirillospora sp. NBC_01491]|uniref:hypothetical protein n=1 Tax=Spirillospora sp. NBC_01491 TaxID=2976007 RepID=UPI002E34F4D8|nr:hypothetical protein [Spirillospora sp. NBC_01491]